MMSALLWPFLLHARRVAQIRTYHSLRKRTLCIFLRVDEIPSEAHTSRCADRKSVRDKLCDGIRTQTGTYAGQRPERARVIIDSCHARWKTRSESASTVTVVQVIVLQTLSLLFSQCTPSLAIQQRCFPSFNADK